jgi:pimeloyl-ACP methyl ester carboxylesterase
LTVQAIRTAAGVEISALVAGEGPLVVLMHGWPELGVSWRHQIQPLAAAGYRVAAPDMRGYGASSKPAEVAAYPGARITPPAGFLAGEKEIALAMSPGGLAEQRELCDDLRVEKILPVAGHWIQQERPAEVSAALISFLDGVRDRL